MSGLGLSFLPAWVNIHLIKYLVIGCGAAFVDLSVFLVLFYQFEMSSMLSHSISVFLSGVFSFTLNASLNYKKTDFILRRFLSFSAIVFFGYCLGALIIFVVERYTNWGGGIGKIISIPVVVACQYILNTKISFRNIAK